MPLNVSSTAFSAGQPIPLQYTCKGKGISPPLAWSGAPAGAKSLALIMDDPDAPMGTFVHWVVYNLPAASSGLPEAVTEGTNLPDGTVQGANSAGRSGYTGPCPPSGTHRYFFKLYALDEVLEPLANTSKEQLLKAMQGHILAQGELMGTFKQ
jgi:Raf kinase inhibitor-like YbhB/YbcL family protein